MPQFAFKAKKGPHEVIEGTLQAANRADAMTKLGAKGCIPISIDEVVPAGETAAEAEVSGVKVPRREINIVTRQFASLVRSGVPLLRALNILEEQADHPALRRVMRGMGEDVRQGGTLSDAMRRYPRVFSPMFVSLVHAGEVGGMLDTVLDRLAAKADRDDALRGKIQGALAYPAFVALTGVATVCFLMSFVLPRLMNLFRGLGGDLPLPTRMLMQTSKVMAQPAFWGAAVVVILALALMFRLPESPLRRAWQGVVLRTPVFGELVRRVELSRFMRAFGMLLEHGINAIEALQVALTAVNHPGIRGPLESLPKALEQGTSLAKAFEESAAVSAFVINTVAVGEEGGKAGEALLEIADFYEREAERRLDVAAALLEPLMVLLVGAMVGWIVVAVMLPIFDLGSII